MTTAQYKITQTRTPWAPSKREKIILNNEFRINVVKLYGFIL